MKRLVVPVALFLLCLALPASMAARDKKPIPNVSAVRHIFFGWIAPDSNAYYDLGYTTMAEWDSVIDHANIRFQQYLKSKYLPDRTVMGAKDKKDENITGDELYVKFSDVSFDTHYVLHLSIHLIDPKTNAEIGVIPSLKYRGHLCALEGCLDQEFDQLSEDLKFYFQGGRPEQW
jgi:hypothetical protein